MKNSTQLKIKEVLGKRGAVFYVICDLGAVQSVLTVLFALSIKFLISGVESKNKEQIIIWTIFLLSAVITSFILGVLYKILLSKYSTELDCKLKRKVFSNFLKSDYKTASASRGGDVISKIESDSLRVSNIYASLTPTMVSTIVHIVAIVIAMTILNWIFTLIVLGVGLIAVFITYFLRIKAGKLYKDVREENSNLSCLVGETVSNTLVVKAFSAEEHIGEVFDNQILKYKKKRLNHRTFTAVITSIIALLFTAFYAFAVIFGVFGISKGISGVDFGVIIATLQLIMQIKAPLNTLSGYVTSKTEMLVSAQRLFDLFDNQSSLENKIECKSEFKKLVLKDVEFSYGQEKVLSGVNLTVEKGQKILITGESGQGKTTLLKVICGLYKTDAGSVVIESESGKISTINSDKFFAFVPQGNMLFLGTVKENVIFSSNVTDESQVTNALNKAELLKDSSYDLSLDTLVGENGSGISEGQAQRVAIARAFISGAPIILADEMTSALDGEVEKRLLDTLKSDSETTLIMVSHKPYASKIADQVYILKDGKLLKS